MKEYKQFNIHRRVPVLFGLACAVVSAILLAAIFIATSRSSATDSTALKNYEITETVRGSVDFGVKQIKSYVHPVGHKSIKQTGRVGVNSVSYVTKFGENGNKISRQKIKETVLSQPIEQIEIVGAKLPNALAKSKGAQHFVDSKGVRHRETYYDLPMNVVINACGAGGYKIREDGAKVDKDGYVLVAANYGNYPRCSVVETSLGPGKVYDTGGFAKNHPHGFDLATDWTNGDGR